MTRALLIAACAAALALPAAAQAADRADRIRHDLLNRQVPRLFSVAHRACWRRAPENSRKAIDDCARLGVDIIEIDVRLSRDGVPMLFHDSGLARMTEGAGKVADHDAADLKKLRLKDHNGGDQAALTDQAMLTLTEALQVVDGRLIAHLDVKDGSKAWPAVWASVKAAHAEAFVLMKILQPADGPEWTDAPFLGQALVRSRVEPETPAALASILCSYKDHKPVAHTVMFETPAVVEALAPAHAKCPMGRMWVATQDPTYAGGLTDDQALAAPDAVWGRLIDSGVTILETDRPEQLTAYLRTRSAGNK